MLICSTRSSWRLHLMAVRRYLGAQRRTPRWRPGDRGLPSLGHPDSQPTGTARSRLTCTFDQFNTIIVKTSDHRFEVLLQTFARVDLGSDSYPLTIRLRPILRGPHPARARLGRPEDRRSVSPDVTRLAARSRPASYSFPNDSPAFSSFR